MLQAVTNYLSNYFLGMNSAENFLGCIASFYLKCPATHQNGQATTFGSPVKNNTIRMKKKKNYGNYVTTKILTLQHASVAETDLNNVTKCLPTPLKPTFLGIVNSFTDAIIAVAAHKCLGQKVAARSINKYCRRVPLRLLPYTREERHSVERFFPPFRKMENSRLVDPT